MKSPAALTLAFLAATSVAGLSCAKHQQAKAPAPQPVAMTAPVVEEEEETIYIAEVPLPAPEVQPVLVETCSVPEQSDVFFAYDSADLTAVDTPQLSDIASCLTTGALAGTTITLVGHADPRGGVEFNQKLGMSRAEMTAKYLEKLGVDPSRITVKSMGKTGANPDPKEWAHDRRVDILIHVPSGGSGNAGSPSSAGGI